MSTFGSLSEQAARKGREKGRGILDILSSTKKEIKKAQEKVGSRLDFKSDMAEQQQKKYQELLRQGRNPQEAQKLSKRWALEYERQLKIQMGKEVPMRTSEFYAVSGAADETFKTASPEQAKKSQTKIEKFMEKHGGKKGWKNVISRIVEWLRKDDKNNILAGWLVSIFGIETAKEGRIAKLIEEAEALMKQKEWAKAKEKIEKVLKEKDEKGDKWAKATLAKIEKEEKKSKKTPEKKEVAPNREKELLTKFFKETEFTNKKTFEKNLTDDLKQLKKEEKTDAMIDGLFGLAIGPSGQLKRMLDNLGNKAFPVRLLDIKLHHLDNNQMVTITAALKENVGKGREILDKIVTLPMSDKKKNEDVIAEIEKTYLKK